MRSCWRDWRRRRLRQRIWTEPAAEPRRAQSTGAGSGGLGRRHSIGGPRARKPCRPSTLHVRSSSLSRAEPGVSGLAVCRAGSQLVRSMAGLPRGAAAFRAFVA